MKKLTSSNMIWCIFVFYLFTIVAFGDRVEYYKYSNITFVVLIGTMALYVMRRTIVVPIDLFIFLPFLVFSFLSITWSYMLDRTLERSITLLKLFVLLYFMSLYLLRSRQTERYIYGIAFAGILILIYVICFYGFSGLRQMISEGSRVGREFVNSNTLAIFLSFSTIILIYHFLDKRKWYYLVLIIGLVVIIATTGSKKGLLDLAVGFIMVTGFNQESSNGAKKLFKWMLGMTIGVVFLYFLWQSPIFATVRERYEIMLGFLSGTSTKIDYSTRERQLMLEAGWKQFRKTPFLGIGIGASGYITDYIFGRDTYLHNEYIELLATGGIIGCSLQILPILFVLTRNWKYRKTSKSSQMCSILLVIYMINGIAAVQYFSKFTYVIFAISLACYLDNKYKEQHIWINNNTRVRKNLESIR